MLAPIPMPMSFRLHVCVWICFYIVYRQLSFKHDDNNNMVAGCKRVIFQPKTWQCILTVRLFFHRFYPSNRKKLDIVRSMMDCLLAKCVPCITDCVMGELEKLGGKYKIALRLAKDPRFERIPCNCKGCYADDCIVQMAKQWRCFIVATCDKELRGRIRKIPGVPCMYISGYKYTVERMPEAFGAPR